MLFDLPGFRLSTSDTPPGTKLTTVHHFRSQQQTLAALLCVLCIGVCPYRVYAVGGEGVAPRTQLLAASRDVLGAEDAGGRGGDGLPEEAAVQHLHGAVDRRREHIGGGVRRGHGWRCCSTMAGRSEFTKDFGESGDDAGSREPGTVLEGV